MGSLTILEKDAPCDDIIDWPLFYMNDFSIVGLVVDNLKTVTNLLEAGGYNIDHNACSASVHFENNGHYKHIFDLLAEHRVDFTMSDIVRCAYQG